MGSKLYKGNVGAQGGVPAFAMKFDGSNADEIGQVSGRVTYKGSDSYGPYVSLNNHPWKTRAGNWALWDEKGEVWTNENDELVLDRWGFKPADQRDGVLLDVAPKVSSTQAVRCPEFDDVEGLRRFVKAIPARFVLDGKRSSCFIKAKDGFSYAVPIDPGFWVVVQDGERHVLPDDLFHERFDLK